MDYLAIFITIFIGGLSVFILTRRFGISNVFSSIICSSICYLFTYLINTQLESEILKILPFIFFGGTFIGMANENIIKSYLDILFCSIVYLIIFNLLYNQIGYIGGTLGTFAFLSILVLIIFKKILFQYILRNKILVNS